MAHLNGFDPQKANVEDAVEQKPNNVQTQKVKVEANDTKKMKEGDSYTLFKLNS